MTLLLTLSTAGIGAVAAWLLSIPLPFLVGPTLAVALVRRKVPDLGVPLRLRNLAMIVAGAYIGTTAPAEWKMEWQYWLVSAAVMCGYVASSAWLAQIYLVKVAQFDRPTALLAGQPGGIMVMMALSDSTAANSGRVLFVHAIRVAAGPLSVALLLSCVGSPVPAGDLQTMSAKVPMSWLDALILFTSCMFGFLVSKRIHLPAAELLGPMLTSLLLIQVGVIQGDLPIWVMLLALSITGASVGSSIPRLELRQLLSDGFQAIVVMVIFIGFAWIYGWGLAQVTTLNSVEFFLAATPSGLTEMPAIASLLGLNASYVAMIETIRFLFCAALATWQTKRSQQVV